MFQATIKETRMTSFGGICQCGNILVGQINSELLREIYPESDLVYHSPLGKEKMKKLFLTNGAFEILDEETKNSTIPIMKSEID